MTPHSFRLRPWLMWYFPLMFFAFQFILRLFPGLVMDEFLVKYQITATDFGLFASLYYLGYAGMQIPMAMCLDKFGPRKVIFMCVLLCGLATCTFALFNAWPVALFSRFLIGATSVAGFLGVSKVISIWFPKKNYGKMVGLTFSFGLLGALYGGRPISLMITHMGWEKVTLLLGLLALLCAALVLIFVRNNPNLNESKDYSFPPLKQLFQNKPLIILALANFLMVGSLEGFADVWGVPYLMQARSMSKLDAASITTFVFTGMLVGGPILTFLADKFKADFLVTAVCGVLMSVLLAGLFLFNPYFSHASLILLMFLLGVLCCYQVLVLSLGTKLVPTPLMGVSVAFLNCINMLGGFFFHTVIGRLMDFFEQGTLLNGINIYSVETASKALMVIPIASLVGTFLVYWSYSQKSCQNALRENALMA